MAAESQLAERRTNKEGGRQAEIEAAHQQKVLDTPRTREACKKLGLVLEDLHFRSHDSFYIPGDSKDLQTLRYEHNEKKRKERLAQVLAERAKVIAAAARKGEVPGVQSGQFLSMLESLFEKEAKRLENDLKGQLRQHSSLVACNEEQLRKEENLQMQMMKRQQKLIEVDLRKEETAKKAKEKLEISMSKNEEKVAKLREQHEQKQVAHARGQLAEEERMERFRQEQAALSSEKSAVWKSKVERIRDRSKQMWVDKKAEGELKLLRLDARIEAVNERREAEKEHRVMRSEEQHLHLMDVRAQRDRIERVEGHRKEELREQIEGNIERIETLLALKDQLLNQRRNRTLKAEATRGVRGVNLARDCLPGPGQYEAPPSCMTEAPCLKFNDCKTGHSEFIDMVTKRTADNPAPGSYDTHILKNGDHINDTHKAVKIGTGNRDSFLDDAMKAKSDLPEPGRYDLPSTLDSRTTRIRRAKVQDPNIDKRSKKNFPEWARPSTDTPGPAGYNVDEFSRREVTRRVCRSLPSLTRDMLRVGPMAATASA